MVRSVVGVRDGPAGHQTDYRRNCHLGVVAVPVVEVERAAQSATPAAALLDRLLKRVPEIMLKVGQHIPQSIVLILYDMLITLCKHY